MKRKAVKERLIAEREEREDMAAAIPNICRCGVYPRLARAIPRASEAASGAQAIEAAPPPSVTPEEAARDVPALRPRERPAPAPE